MLSRLITGALAMVLVVTIVSTPGVSPGALASGGDDEVAITDPVPVLPESDGEAADALSIEEPDAMLPEPVEAEVSARCALEGGRSRRVARVVDTGTAGLRVRDGPGREFPTSLILADGALVQVVDGPSFDREARPWYQIAGPDPSPVQGWSSGEYLALLDPCLPELNGDRLEPPGLLGRVFSARITAYTYQEPGNGAHGWITRSGLPVRWGIVAVDPAIIPLGSHLAIEGFRDRFLAADTGFGVRGHHVDIFFEDHATAVRFGVQYREVVVLFA